MKLLDRFRQFMLGRYGTDQLNTTLIVAYLVVYMIGAFFRSSIVVFLSNVFLVLWFCRTFSKNTQRRYEENQKFLMKVQPIQRKYHLFIRKRKEKDTHCFFKCESCGQVIRVPKGKGKIAITCPKCHKEFIKET